MKSDGAILAAPDWSRGDRVVVYTKRTSASDSDLWTVPLAGDRKPAAFLETTYIEAGGVFSPDGQWIAYESTRLAATKCTFDRFLSSRGSIQFRAMADGPRAGVETPGALLPVTRRHVDGGWHRHDEELCPNPSSAALHDRAQTRGFHPYTVTRDGQRFLIPREMPPAPITVVLNWATRPAK